MRILHAVGGLSPDHRFGGISRVTIDIAREQLKRGHEVRIVSSNIGFPRERPRSVEGVPVSLLRSVHPWPSLGFGTVFSPGLAPFILRQARSADILHVHISREFNTLLAARVGQRLNVPVVFQTHGMLDSPRGRLAQVVDRLMVKPVMRSPAIALTLTDDEDHELLRLSGGSIRPVRFPNGVHVATPTSVTASSRTSVLFLARLHPRKGAVIFTRSALELAAFHPTLTFDIVGPDEGDAAEVLRLISGSPVNNVRYWGPAAHSTVLRLMDSARLYVLPAEKEPFGLTVIEALAAGAPVIVHESAMLADDVSNYSAGWVTSSGTAALTRSMAEALSSPYEIEVRGKAGRDFVAAQYGLSRVADLLDDVYANVLDLHSSLAVSARNRSD